MSLEGFLGIKRLTDECAGCAGVLTGLINGSPTDLKEYELQNYAIESFAFIIAFLCYQDGISLAEAGQCNACFIGNIFGNNKDIFYKSAKAIDFYLRLLIKFKSKNEDFLKYSIIYFNLKNPQSWNDFNNGIPLEEMNFFECVETQLKITDFLSNHLIKRINPILAEMK